MMREVKSSGIAWIGTIPKCWETDKLKYHLRRNEPRNPGDVVVLSLYRELGVIPKDSRDDNHNVTSEDTSKYKYVRPGDFVINKMKAWQGSVAVSEYEGIVSPAYFVYEFTDDAIFKRYFHYLLRSCYKDEFMRLSGGIRVGQWDLPADALENTPILIPPMDEQRRIADFLDAKCAEIDALTADIQTQIDTLEQYKRSVITETVTKGLNPDAEMKDSGIEWVGAIPAHWSIHPVYTYFGERKNKNSFGREDNLLSLSYGRVIRKDINTSDGLLPESFNTYNIVEAGDIIIRPTDLQNDKRSLRTGLVKEHGIITSAYIDLYPLKKVDSRYFYFLLHAYDIMKVFYNMGNGVRQGLNYSEFSRLMVFEPPYDEQVAMADYLEAKVEEVDAVISDKKAQLATLDEYKKSLIFEYVPEAWGDFVNDVREFIRFYGFGEILDPSVYEKVKRRKQDYIYCSVEFDEGYKSYYYIADDDSIQVGDYVVVPAGKDNHHSVAEVVKIEYFAKDNVPLPIEKTKHIIRKCTDDDEAIFSNLSCSAWVSIIERYITILNHLHTVNQYIKS